MNNHQLGRLPVTHNRHGVRVRSDDVLVYEASAVLRAIITRHRRHGIMGFYVDVDWLKKHLDDDEFLTQRVLTGAGFAPNEEGRWTWRGGALPLSKVTNLDEFGDALVSIVDVHRPA